MPSPFTIIQGKEGSTPKTPVFLYTIKSPDGDFCYLSNRTYGTNTITYGGNIYLSRVLNTEFEAVQELGPLGYDTIPGFTIEITDADKSVWLNHCMMHGWRGSDVTLTVFLWDVVANQYSTDAYTWNFIGGNPQHDQASGITSLDVTSAINFARLKVPSVPLSARCTWGFPGTYLQRVQALTNPTSVYYQCGYSADVPGGFGNLISRTTLAGTIISTDVTVNVSSSSNFPPVPFQATCDGEEFLVTNVSGSTCSILRGQNNTAAAGHGAGATFYVPFEDCDLTRSGGPPSAPGFDPSIGCMARLGNSATTSVAPDGDLTHDKAGNYTATFGGVTWVAPSSFSGKAFLTSSQTFGFNQSNNALPGSFYNWVYGTQWVQGQVLAPAGDSNSNRSEVAVCLAAFGEATVVQVIVNGVTIPYSNSNDNLFTWRYVNRGGRKGALNHDAIYSDHSHSGLGDPHGSVCVIEFVVPAQLAQPGTVPSCQVLVTSGPILNVYAITNIVSGTVNFSGPNMSLAASLTVIIVGNSNPLLNGTFTVSSVPSGTSAVLSGTSESGTGGGAFFYQVPDLFDAAGDIISNPTGMYVNTSGPASNVVFALLDLLVWGNVTISQIDPVSFYKAAMFAAALISYTTAANTTAEHSQFKCSFSLSGSSRQTLASVITGVRNAGLLMLGTNTDDGMIQCHVKRTLADQQPSPVPGSNYNTPVPSMVYLFQGKWLAAVTYSQGDMVIYAGTYYTAITSSTTGNTPASSPSFWSATTQPVGYVAYLFDETNIEKGSFRITTARVESTPNAVEISFQDEQNGYVVDNLNEVDAISYAFSGNQENVVPISIVGISNFDQASRIANTILGENEYGNNRDDPGGTLYFEFVCNQRVMHLTSSLGFICGLVFQELGLGVILSGVSDNAPQTIRITSVKPDSNGEHWLIKAAYHNDAWYTYAYGQNPTPFQQNPLVGPGSRPVYPWRPCQDPGNNDTTSRSALLVNYGGVPGKSFGVSLDLSKYPAQINVNGMVPVNVQSNIRPPTLPLNGSTNTSGLLPLGLYFVGVTASGLSGPVSILFTTVQAPNGLNNNALILDNIQWPPYAASDVGVFLGPDVFHMGYIGNTGSGTWVGSNLDGNGNPTTITINNFASTQGVQGLPDQLFYQVGVIQQGIAHGGIWGAVVASNSSPTATIVGAGFTTNQWANRVISVYYTPGDSQQYTYNRQVLSNTLNTLTCKSNSTPLKSGSVVVMRCKATTFSDSTIGDSGFVNSFYPAFVAAASYRGSMGLNDLTSGGTYSSTLSGTYIVTISATGGSDSFTWSVNGGTPSGSITITGSSQVLSNGVTVTFAAVTGHTIGDSWSIIGNAGGLDTLNGTEIGRQILIIFGKGSGSSPKTIVSNNNTTYTIDGVFDVTPDNNSIFIVLYPTQQLTYGSGLSVTNPTPVVNSGAIVASFPCATTAEQSMFLLVAASDINGNYAPLKYQPWREVFVPEQVFGSTNPGYFPITPDPVTGDALIDLANGFIQQITLNFPNALGSVAITILAPIFTNGVIQNGMNQLTLLLDQDVSGGEAIPVFAGGVGAFASSTNDQITVCGVSSTRTTLVFAYLNGAFCLVAQTTNGSIT